MAKAYWIATYTAIHNPEKFAAYAKLAGPALQKAGGRFLARGNPSQCYEGAMSQRVVLLEFPSVDHAVKAHDSPEYQEALRALGEKSVDRGIRIVEGVE